MIGKTTTPGTYEIPKNVGSPNASANTSGPQKAAGFAVNGSNQFMQGFLERIFSSLGIGSDPAASLKSELAAPSFGNPAVPAAATAPITVAQSAADIGSGGGITMDTGSSKDELKKLLGAELKKGALADIDWTKLSEEDAAKMIENLQEGNAANSVLSNLASKTGSETAPAAPPAAEAAVHATGTHLA